MRRKNRFRPTVEILEGRRLMAGDLGFEEVGATPEEPARIVAIVDTTISGNTADSSGNGGGILNDGANALRIATDFGGDGDVDIVQVRQVDDGSDAARHTYTSGGIFTITVTVSDGDTGNQVDSNTVDDIISSPTPDGGPHVRVFDGLTGIPSTA